MTSAGPVDTPPDGDSDAVEVLLAGRDDQTASLGRAVRALVHDLDPDGRLDTLEDVQRPAVAQMLVRARRHRARTTHSSGGSRSPGGPRS